MSDYLPPTGPPPPKVPEGWKAVYNDQYKEWFYVNLHTKASQWDLPTSPAPGAGGDSAPPPGPPPSYSTGPDAPRTTGDSKTSHLESNNPYNQHNTIAGGPSGNTESDAALAARLQAEEDARARGGGHSPNPGAASSYYGDQQQGPGTPQGPLYDQQQDRGSSGGKKSGGFLGKLLGKASGKTGGMGGFGHSQHQQPPYGQQQYGGYGGGGYPPPQQQQGYYPPQQGGYGPGGGYGGYPPQQQQQGFMGGGGGRKPGKGGMGAGGAAALGLGGGLLGGALLADAIDDHDDREYDQGYQDGQDNDFGGGGGDDFGGGDF